MSNSETQSQDPYYEAVSPTEEDLLWLEIAREQLKNSIKVQDEAAKQLITITTFSQTVYFAAVSFSEIKKGLALVPSNKQLLIVVALVSPLFFWLFSLCFATRVFKPKKYETNVVMPETARHTYLQITAHKQEQLNRAHLALILGFVPLLINVIGYLLYFPLGKDKI